MKGFHHLAKFNIREVARNNAEAQRAADEANIASRQALIDKEKEKYDKMISAFDKGERLGKIGYGMLLLLLPWAAFVYFFLAEVFTFLAPSKKPNVIADTNIFLPMERFLGIIRYLFYPIYFLSKGYFFTSFFLNKETKQVPKAYYPDRQKYDLDAYRSMVSTWSSDPNFSIPNLLLEGLPGVGKTLFAKNVFKINSISFIKTNSKLLKQLVEDKDSGAVEREIIALFNMARDSYRRNSRKVIIFIDEAEKLGPQIETLLGLMDEADAKNVAVILSCNDASKLPDAVVSRMGQKIYITPPTKDEISSIMIDSIGRAKEVYPNIDFFDLEENKSELSILFVALDNRDKSERIVGRDISSKVNRIAGRANARYLNVSPKRKKERPSRVSIDELFDVFGLDIEQERLKLEIAEIDKELKEVQMKKEGAKNREEKNSIKVKINELQLQKEHAISRLQEDMPPLESGEKFKKTKKTKFPFKKN